MRWSRRANGEERGETSGERARKEERKTDRAREDQVLLLQRAVQSEHQRSRSHRIDARRSTAGERCARTTHLVHLGDPLRGPRAPREHDDALALPAVAVDDVDDLVSERLPALVAVRAGLVRRDGERRVEEEDARARERDEVAAEGRRRVRASASQVLRARPGSRPRGAEPRARMRERADAPVLGHLERRVLVLDLFVDVAQRGRDLDARADREAEACGRARGGRGEGQRENEGDEERGERERRAVRLTCGSATGVS